MRDSVRSLCDRYAATQGDFAKFPLPREFIEHANRARIKSLRVPKEGIRGLVEHVARAAKAALEEMNALLTSPPRDASAL